MEKATGARTKQPSLLTGVLFDDAGGRLTPTHCVKKGRRYRYYVSTPLVTGTAKGCSSRRRIPAGDIETKVIDRLRTFLANRSEILDALINEADSRVSRQDMFERACQIADDLGTRPPEEIKRIVMALIYRVEIGPDCLQISLSGSRLAALLVARSIPADNDKSSDSRDDTLILKVGARLQRVGRELKMVVNGHNEDAGADPSLLKIVARAHDIQGRLAQNTELSVHDIARHEGVSAAYIYSLLRLPWLAPDITAAIVNGRQPPQLNAMKLMRLTARLPAEWPAQRALLGFH